VFLYGDGVGLGLISKETVHAVLSQGVFYLYLLSVIIFWHLNSSNNEGRDSILNNQIRFVFTCVPWMYAAIELASFKMKIWHHFAAMVSVLLNLTGGLYVDAVALDVNEGISYQSWGDLFAIVALLSFGSANKIEKLLIGIFYLLILFAIPSRSSLLFYIVTLGLYFLYIGWTRMKIISILFGLMAIVVVYIYGSELTGFLEVILGDSRHVTLIEQEKSESNYVRYMTIIYGTEAFMASPLIGDYAFQLKYLSNAGLYMHNFFDFFVQYGLVGFILLFLVLYFAYKDIIRKKIYVESNESLVLVTIFCFSSFMAARNYAATYLFVGIGFLFIFIKKLKIAN
jgi:hypothetical protein